MDSESEESHSSESEGSPISEQEGSHSSESEGSHSSESEGSHSSESEGSYSSEPEGNDGYYSSHDSDANQSVRGDDDDDDDGDEGISSRKDRISELSDSILIRILSFLPIKYVVATSILSKRWQFLWTMVPNLVFRFRKRDKCFLNSIDRTLVLHQNSHIKKFLIDFSYQLQFQSSVNVWIRHATRKNVEELHLEFRVCQDIHSSPMDYAHTLPQFLYANSSIVKLSLRFCNIKPIGVISWPSLKTLSIGSVELCDGVIKDILSGCPALESLELHHCFGINSLNITSASLKKLVINRYWDSSHSHHRSVLKISAPNVQSLSILGNMYTKECRVTNVPSLFDASLNFELAMQEGNSKDHYRWYHKVVMKLLKSVNHVQALTVGTWCIQVLSIFEGKDLSSLLSNLKCLLLHTQFNKWDLPGIENLLQSSTNLEIFIINMISPCSRQISEEVGFSFTDLHNFDEEKYWSLREGVLVNSLINLKIVKIVGVIWNQPGIELVFGLVKFLLKNARMLEKVEICAKRYSHSRLLWNSSKSAQSLLSSPRASPNAVVLFS